MTCWTGHLWFTLAGLSSEYGGIDSLLCDLVMMCIPSLFYFKRTQSPSSVGNNVWLSAFLEQISPIFSIFTSHTAFPTDSLVYQIKWDFLLCLLANICKYGQSGFILNIHVSIDKWSFKIPVFREESASMSDPEINVPKPVLAFWYWILNNRLAIGCKGQHDKPHVQFNLLWKVESVLSCNSK